MVLSNLFAHVQHLMLHEFLQCLLGEEQLRGACFMSVSANVAYVFISESINVRIGFVVLCESVCALFHKSPPLLSF
jgi:hypothetical protein